MATGPMPSVSPEGRELILQIESRLPQLSPIMRSIGGYCIRTHAWLHETSIDEVADHCGTVPSSVVRFTRLFGRQGFQDFKWAFRDCRERSPEVGPDAKAGPSARLLNMFDEDVHQLSELRTLLQQDVFQVAIDWIRGQPKVSLTFFGEFDRMVAVHLGNALQHAGKVVLLADRLPSRALRPAQAHVTCVNVDLERPGLHRVHPTPSGEPAPIGGHQIDVQGVDRHFSVRASPHTLCLPVSGSTLGRRLQKALSMANTIGAALH
jgi:Helix-turn-helix domain, rpiR family